MSSLHHPFSPPFPYILTSSSLPSPFLSSHPLSRCEICCRCVSRLPWNSVYIQSIRKRIMRMDWASRAGKLSVIDTLWIVGYKGLLAVNIILSRYRISFLWPLSFHSCLLYYDSFSPFALITSFLYYSYLIFFTPHFSRHLSFISCVIIIIFE